MYTERKFVYICDMKNTSNMNIIETIVAKLTTETAQFRVDFMHQIAEWSITEKQRIDSLVNWYKTTPIVRPKRKSEQFTYCIGGITRTSTTFVNDFSNMTEQEKADFLKHESMEKWMWSTGYSVSQMSQQDFSKKELKKAEKWFDDSIVKLATKINGKGLNLDALQMSSTYVERNLCTTITDGVKKVKAQTIFACGEINRPHFRYLVK
jgi:hypothetical protein